MATSPLDEMIYRFMSKYSVLLSAVRKEILKALPYITKWNAERTISNILQRYHVKKEIADDFISNVKQMVSIAADAPVNQLLVNDALLTHAWTVDKELFSSKVNKLTRIDEVLGTIKKGLNYGQSMRDISENIFETGVQKGDVTELVNQLSNTARLAARNANDIDLQRQLMRDIRQMQSQIDRLVNPDTSTLKRAYQNVIDAAEKMNTAAMEKAVDYAVYFKQKYNAGRIADTEFARAYGNTRIAEAHFDPDVTCLKVVLSSAHRGFDICDFYANADQYGYGAGIFPKDHLPNFPFHPHCHCGFEDIYGIEIPEANASDFNPNAGKSYLHSLSAGERRSVMGIDNSKEFADAPNKWEKLVRGYEHPVKQKILLPEETFYKG